MDRIEEVLETITSGEKNGRAWKLVKATTKSGKEVKGFNLKEGMEGYVKWNEKYKQNDFVVPRRGGKASASKGTDSKEVLKAISELKQQIEIQTNLIKKLLGDDPEDNQEKEVVLDDIEDGEPVDLDSIPF